MSSLSSSPSNQKKFWRSLNELENTPEFEQMLQREFPENASELKDPISRRTFLKIMGASMFLAGFAGCGVRRPVEKIMPYALAPENLIPGRPVFYATASVLGDEVVGVLAESHEGRPTKLEGNAAFPWNKGSLKSFHQASVLDLYDPDRLTGVVSPDADKVFSVSDIEDVIRKQVAVMSEKNGQGFGLLVENHLSPSVTRLLKKISEKFPQVKLYWYNPSSQNEFHRMSVSLFDKILRPFYDFKKAKRIVSVGSDFLGATVPGSLRYTKDFSFHRDPEETPAMNRLYVFESDFTLTGSMADHRYKTRASEYGAVLIQLAAQVIETVKDIPADTHEIRDLILSRAKEVNVSSLDRKSLGVIAADLIAHRGESLVVAGAELPSSLQGVVVFLNMVLGNLGKTFALHDLSTDLPFMRHNSEESLMRLVEDIRQQQVKDLYILGGDPVYLSPDALGLAESLKQLNSVVYLSDRENETSALSTWVIPKKHYLESWGDLRSQEGSVSIVQPLIMPLYPVSMNEVELLSLILGERQSDYDIIRETYSPKSDWSENSWRKWLHDGFVNLEDPAVSRAGVANWNVLVQNLNQHGFLFSVNHEFELNLKFSNVLFDGRFANNGWMQELPEPMTKLTWDNAILISPKTASRFNVSTGDVVTVSKNAKKFEIPVFIMPGHAEDSATVHVGYGRLIKGRVGQGVGVDVSPLAEKNVSGLVQGVTISVTGKKVKLASTQDHWGIQGRPVFRGTTVSEYEHHPLFAKEMVEVPHSESSWEEKKYDSGYQWGMAVDLSRCTGCNACVTGCQSENNIPIVGKEMVLNGREMHWIRLDRYFEGEIDNPVSAIAPMACMQCENAPCEQVCPVAATTHSEEGLNDMTYNRCIGTRYCSNNCPVKVRRFNYFDYHQTNPQAVDKPREHLFDGFKMPDVQIQKQFNPDVTIRMRGVMEKCTYCVQRINQVKIDAKNEGRKVKDGEITPACAQTCPADAISFGNILDANARVSKVKAKNRDYALLTELHLKPRTTFLAQIKNPNPLLSAGNISKQVHA